MSARETLQPRPRRPGLLVYIMNHPGTSAIWVILRLATWLVHLQLEPPRRERSAVTDRMIGSAQADSRLWCVGHPLAPGVLKLGTEEPVRRHLQPSQYRLAEDRVLHVRELPRHWRPDQRLPSHCRTVSRYRVPSPEARWAMARPRGPRACWVARAACLGNSPYRSPTRLPRSGWPIISVCGILSSEPRAGLSRASHSNHRKGDAGFLQPTTRLS